MLHSKSSVNDSGIRNNIIFTVLLQYHFLSTFHTDKPCVFRKFKLENSQDSTFAHISGKLVTHSKTRQQT